MSKQYEFEEVFDPKTNIELDTTLSKGGEAADAKAVGDALGGKVNVTDIVDNTTTEDATKPLSAKQGKAIKGIVDRVSTEQTAQRQRIEGLENKSLDMVREFNFARGDNDYVDVKEDGIEWSNDETEIETEPDEGDFDYFYSKSRNRVPIVAGEGITFEKDNANNVVKINATAKSNDDTGALKTAQVSVTYSELKALRDSSKLTPGMFYRITDYVCTTAQPDTRAMNNKFDIIVQALSKNTLSENAKADYHVDVIGDGGSGNDSVVGTWVFNDEITLPKESGEYKYYASFSACSIEGFVGSFNCIYFHIYDDSDGSDGYAAFSGDEDYFDEVYLESRGWTQEVYKTITISEEPTDNNFISWLKANATKQGVRNSSGGNYAFKSDVLADEDGTLVNNAVTPYYYIFEDTADGDLGEDGTHENYKGDDKFIAYGYEENNKGITVPTLYKTDTKSEDPEYENPDYEDVFYYVGTAELNGTTYDKWRKINVGDSMPHWEDDPRYSNEPGKIYVLTNFIIESSGTIKHLANANVPSWELKYCLDNDTTRFAWAVDDSIIGTWVFNDEITAPNEMPSHFYCEYYVDSPYDGLQRVNEIRVYRIDSENIDDNFVISYYGENYDMEDVYEKEYGWNNEAYKTITITAEPADPNFIAWLKANATKQDNNSGGKGVIYYMKDEHGNECPYDFKNIQFKRKVSLENGYPELDEENGEETWVYTFCGNSYHIDNDKWSALKDGSLESPCGHQSDENTSTFHHNVMKPYILLYDGENEDYTVCGKQYLNNNVFFGYWEEIGSTNAENPYYYAYCCYFNTLGSNCYSNSFSRNCKYNIFGNSCFSNTFGNYCHSNTFGDDCPYNIFGNSCYQNIFGNSCHHNTFGSYCTSNTFDNSCDSNIFGNHFSFNTLEIYCNDNRIPDNIRYIHICKGVSGKTLTPEPKANYEQIYRLSGSKEILI